MLTKIKMALPMLMSTSTKISQDTSAAMSNVTKPIVDLINSLMNPLLAIVGAIGLLYCILLGVKYAKAEEQQEHEKAKKHLKNAIIGFVLIFVLMYLLKAGTSLMSTWYYANI